MKYKYYTPISIFLLFILTFSFLLFTPGYAGAKTKELKIGMGKGKAQITLLKGTVYLSRKGLFKPKTLKKNDFLIQGDRINTAKNARIEIRLPDKSYIRFGELTEFILAAASIDKKNKRRNINVKMIIGKIWARASKLFSGRGRFAISTRTAVAGVRGTVYRMDVNQDSSAEVRVYYGEVAVSNKKEEEKKKGTIKKSGGPKRVSGPRAIPGPRKVSIKEWTHIVRSMQQIIIKPDGTASKPFRFSLEADKSEWVLWNQRRDKKLESKE